MATKKKTSGKIELVKGQSHVLAVSKKDKLGLTFASKGNPVYQIELGRGEGEDVAFVPYRPLSLQEGRDGSLELDVSTYTHVRISIDSPSGVIYYCMA